MKLTPHVIDAKPRCSDPLGQRGHILLIFDEEKMLVEVPSHDDKAAIASELALVIASEALIALRAALGLPRLDGKKGVEELGVGIERIMAGTLLTTQV